MAIRMPAVPVGLIGMGIGARVIAGRLPRRSTTSRTPRRETRSTATSRPSRGAPPINTLTAAQLFDLEKKRRLSTRAVAAELTRRKRQGTAIRSGKLVRVRAGVGPGAVSPRRIRGRAPTPDQARTRSARQADLRRKVSPERAKAELERRRTRPQAPTARAERRSTEPRTKTETRAPTKEPTRRQRVFGRFRQTEATRLQEILDRKKRKRAAPTPPTAPKAPDARKKRVPGSPAGAKVEQIKPIQPPSRPPAPDASRAAAEGRLRAKGVTLGRQVDLAQALERGGGKNDLVTVGFQSADVDKAAKRNIATRTLRDRGLIDAKGAVDTNKALAEGVKAGVLLDAGFTAGQLARAKVEARVARAKSAPRDLVAEIRDKNIQPRALIRQGFSREDVKQAQLRIFADRQLKKFETKSGDVNISSALATGVPPKVLKDAGFASADISSAKREVDAAAAVPKRVRIAKAAGSTLLDITPVYGTVRTWEQSSNLVRGVNIATDILTIVPIAGGAAAGVRAGGRVLPAVTRSVVAEAVSPITAIRRPIRTAKAALDPIEIALRPSRIPLSATSIRDTTVRIPLARTREFADTEGAQRAVGRVTLDAIRTGKGVGKIGAEGAEGEIRLSKIGLRKVSSEPIAIHATPDIRAFQQGAVIQGKEGGLFVAPSLHTRFTRASAFGDVPVGGVPGALIIRDAKITNKLKSSGKTFGNKIEVEAVLPAGTRLAAPSQYLFTRGADGGKLVLAIVGKPFTRGEIAKLKFFGSVESVSQIFRQPLRLSATKGSKRLTQAFDNNVKVQKQIFDATESLTKARRGKRTEEVQRLTNELGDLRKQLARSNDRVTALGTAKFGTRVAAAYFGDQDVSAALRATSGKPKRGKSPVRDVIRSPRTRPSSPQRAAARAVRRVTPPASVKSRAAAPRTPSDVTPAPGLAPRRKPTSRTPAGRPLTPRVPGPRSTTPRAPAPRVVPPRVPGIATPAPRVPTPGVPVPRDTRGPTGKKRPIRFRLPGGDRTPKLRPGTFPRIVAWRQGFVRIKLDIDTGEKKFTRTKEQTPLTPAQSFRVVTTDRTRPKPQSFRQGVVRIDVRPNSIAFKGLRRRRRSSRSIG